MTTQETSHPVLTAIQQRVAWEGWFGAEVRAYYFADLSTHYRSIQRAVNWITLFGSSAALASVLATWLSQTLPWLPAVVALFPTGLSLYSLVADNPRRATDSGDLHSRWDALAREYRRLWDGMWADDAARTLEQLEQQESELSRLGLTCSSRRDERRMDKWYRRVEAEHRVAWTHAEPVA